MDKLEGETDTFCQFWGICALIYFSFFNKKTKIDNKAIYQKSYKWNIHSTKINSPKPHNVINNISSLHKRRTKNVMKDWAIFLKTVIIHNLLIISLDGQYQSILHSSLKFPKKEITNSLNIRKIPINSTNSTQRIWETQNFSNKSFQLARLGNNSHLFFN